MITDQRYSVIAIGLHWLIALLIVGMIAVGKFMVSLDEADVLRFDLTQWHKSFGMLILFLSLLRLLWRWMHKPPPLPADTRPWERFAAAAVHVLLYALMIGIPLTGWVMVSASTLGISTILFDVVTLPHLPGVENNAEISELFAEFHELAATITIALVVMHAGAALRHHFLLGDGVLVRMLPDMTDAATCARVLKFGALILAGAAAIGIASQTASRDVPVFDGPSKVGFTLNLMGDSLEGRFEQSSVRFVYDSENVEASSLTATVVTNTGVTGNPQVDDALATADWFASEQFPEARFVSKEFSAAANNAVAVNGDLTIRDATLPVSFEMTLDPEANLATGEFVIDRLDFAIGAKEQPDASTVDIDVKISFEFRLVDDSSQ